ncbi:unnamed protein product [Cuscuta campestris]|uniref:RBR-type E3 ubiquitin transferase n=1 Tax=Cuscuta campestris TaxID=132261 RepID=A0A484KBU6_9ASTE|nr:unnamed protein product [Cuscuta campestris]
MKSMEYEGLLDSLIDEQRREFMAAITLESDLRFAFNLQMQEAITASLSETSEPSTSTSPPPPPHFDGDGCEGFDYTTLLLEDLARFDQERRDQLQSETLIRSMKQDLDRRAHDHKFAREIMSIPEDQWAETGDDIHRPYGDGVGNQTEIVRMYCKGIVSEEMIKDMRVAVASIGVAICDFQDNILFEMKRGLENGGMLTNEGAELEALVAGLEAAVALNLERVNFFCDNYMVYQHVSGRSQANQSKIATLVNKVIDFKKRFSFCEPSYVGRNEIKFAFKLAREAIISQVAWSVETKAGKSLKETCAICFEDINVTKMFLIDGCLHRFCFSCMKQHVEAKLLVGKMAECPHDGCKTNIEVDNCANFLDPRLVEIISNRMKEASIAVTDKVYCPYPRCSALMSKVKVLEYTKNEFFGAETSGARKCMKCNKYFCLNCQVPWHYDMTCLVYKRTPRPQSDESAVKALANKRKWRQCVKCNHMVELSSGCYHISCRCGYEFCYTCGAEWKNKRATCNCALWDERNLIRPR